MSAVILAIAVVGGVGLFVGIFLGIAGKHRSMPAR